MNFSFCFAFFSPFHDCKIHSKMIWHFLSFFHRLMSLKNNNRHHHHHHHHRHRHYSSLAMIVTRQRMRNVFLLLLLLKFNCTSTSIELLTGQTQNHIDWTKMGLKKSRAVWRQYQQKLIPFVNEERISFFVHLSNENLFKIHWTVCVSVCSPLFYDGDAILLSFFAQSLRLYDRKIDCKTVKWQWSNSVGALGGQRGACEIYVRLRVAKKSFC